MQTMFKDVFVLRKTSWHVRMMKYIWNLDYKSFSHMCPYWWLSVFNVLVAFIPVFIIKEGYNLLSVILPVIGGVLVEVLDFVWKYFKLLIKYTLSIPLGWVWGILCAINAAILEWYDKVTEKKRKDAETRAEGKRLAEELRLMEMVERIKDNHQKFIEDSNGMIDEGLKKFIRYHDGAFFSKLMDGVAEFSYKQHEIGREKELKRRARLIQMQQEQPTVYEQPMNPTRKKGKTFAEMEAERAEREKQRIIRNKALIVKLNNFIKPIMKVVAYIIGAFSAAGLLYGLYKALPYIAKAIIWLWYALIWLIEGIWWVLCQIGGFFVWTGEGVADIKHSTWVELGSFSMWPVLSTLFIFLMIIGGMALSDYMKSQKQKRKTTMFTKVSGEPYQLKKREISMLRHSIMGLDILIDGWKKHVGTPWSWFFKRIWKGFIMLLGILIDFLDMLITYLIQFFRFLVKCIKFFIQMLKNQCPAIKWED